ncbi:MAG TPA: lipopolysaccharide biosynthesis protein [Azospirillum sp.]|nr:lipopolysaccharide biosynthesis protein [Azospirillum sp.]
MTQFVPSTGGELDRGSIKRASITGMGVNLTSQLLRLLLAFVYQVAISRILVPSDFGLVAMAAPALAFVGLFADFGLTMATIQRAQITQAQLSFLFWVNGALSLLLSVAVIAVAPVAGWFYGEPRVGPILAALGGLFFLRGLCAQHLALLNRRLMFVRLAVIDMASLVGGALVGVATALYGFGYWSLVANQATSTALTVVLAWLCMRWVPGRPAWDAEARSLLGFGGNVTAFNFVNYFARNLDNVLIGRFHGEVALGLYDRAYKLFLLPLSQVTGPIGKVALPLLARTLHEPDLYRRSYLGMLEAILLLTSPAVLFAMCTSHQLIVTMLGDRWADVAPIFSVLAVGALFAPVGHSTGWLFLSQNRTREMRNWGTIGSVMFVISFVIGLPWGALGVAVSYVTVGLFQGPMVWWAATRRGPVTFKQLALALYPYAVAAAATVVVEYNLQRLLPQGLGPLVLLLAAAYGAFFATLAVLPRGRNTFSALLVQGRAYLAGIGART